ncbi:hypothetical protein TELCIR_00954 [Teladorsagia circumcincta]|uniref:Reverse transcriptase domain-containing protein n=1 Tax=Teladorsagia circumcincta TaxID=45464 RepID=A0A2G9V4R6_TELCI|nr:hypothetical protein TELCIR_00954 [Teladorsagia circumcincta]
MEVTAGLSACLGLEDAREQARLPKSSPVNVGVHQGPAFSSLLFMLPMDTITNYLQNDAPWNLLYADDSLLAATSKEELQDRILI